MMIPSMPTLTGSRDFRVKGGPATICGYYNNINYKLIVKDPNGPVCQHIENPKLICPEYFDDGMCKLFLGESKKGEIWNHYRMGNQPI